MLANPLLRADCPDPCVVRVGDGYLLAATTFFNDVEDKFPLYASPDLVDWKHVGHVFPRHQLPTWAVSEFWAPEIHRVGDEWLCYFTARDREGRLCIGVARAERAEGPYRDHGAPILRDDRVGLIDAHRFDDTDGRAWLFWKVDGNDLRPQESTPIHVQELARDGVTRVGEPTLVIRNDREWEGHVIEGPWAVRRGEHVYLFYSGNAFHTDAYGVGVARARDVRGPWEKLAQPILSSTQRWRGPGHGCVLCTGDTDLFIYHAWDGDRVFARHPRIPLVACVRFSGGWPMLEPLPDR